MDLRTEIENIVHEILMEGVTKEDAVKELLNLHSVSGSEYQEKILKKADEMKESGKIWHSNKVYTDGIDCALDNMKEHIKRIGEKHYR